MVRTVIILFNSVINNRLLNLFNEAISHSQFGFRKNRTTTESIFIVKTLLNKYINQKRRKFMDVSLTLKKHLTLYGGLDFYIK